MPFYTISLVYAIGSRQGDSNLEVVQPNEAYTGVVRMDKNKAYERVKNHRNTPGLEQPHIYDEIGLKKQESSNIDPVYAEISEPVGRPRMSTSVPIM